MNNVYINFNTGKDTNKGTIDNPLQTFSSIQDNSIVILQGKFIPIISLTNKKNILVLPQGVNVLPVQKLPTDPITDFTTCAIVLNGCLDCKISNVSISTSYFIPSPSVPKLPAKGVLLSNCSRCVVQNSELFSQRSTAGWTAKTWVNNKAGFLISGGAGNNKILSNHIFNCGGIQMKGSGNLADGNLVENMPSDGAGIWSYNNTFSNNTVRNSHKVDGNHNDLLQIGPGVQGAQVINNILTAYSDPKQPFIATDVQGIGAFDKSAKILVKNNKVSVDHPIGIWFDYTTDTIIEGNTVKLCGSKAWQPSRLPSIAIHIGKSGAIPTKNTLKNNVSINYEIYPKSLILQENNYNSTTKKYVVFP